MLQPALPRSVTNRYTVPAIDRAVDVLRHRSQSCTDLRLSTLAETTHVPKSTLFPIMSTLEDRGCVVRDEKQKTYRLGLTLWELGNTFLNQSDLLETAETHMERLANACEESVFLGLLDEDEVVYVRRAESPKLAVVVRKVGQRAPVYCTATGLAILAFLPREETARITERQPLQAYTPKTTPDRATLSQTLEAIRQARVAVVDEEYNASLLCVSAPVLNDEERPVASRTAALLSAHAHEVQIEVKHQIRDTAHAVSTECGYRGDPFSPVGPTS